MGDEKLIFAPLIRVSTERQEKQGQSLETQRKQLTASIQRLGGQTYDWYGGQEHATPDHERRELDRLMKDAEAKRFDAVMVADISRWSRDNGKSKEYLRRFKDKAIKFYVLSREVDLFDPSQFFMLGMNVEVAEFFADQQSYKSIINRIERAEKGYPSSSGRAPYGRIFNRETGVWTVDEEKKRKIEEAARLYLEEDVSLMVLGKQFGINHAHLWEVLTQRCGDTWDQRFQEKRFGIDATVTTKVPRLLPEETIQRLRAKCEARRVWAKGSPRKYQYLFSHIIYDEESGYTLTGVTDHRGQQYYRPFHKVRPRYMINVKVIEKAVLDALFQALSDNRALTHAVFEGNASTAAVEALMKRKEASEKALSACEQRLSNTARALENFHGENLDRFVKTVKERVIAIEQEWSKLLFDIQAIQNQLNDIPTREEIISKREWISRQLKLRVGESYFRSGAAFYDLPYDAKRRLVLLIFGGKDENGKRYGIYIRPIEGATRKYKFLAYGRLGDIGGWVEGRTGRYCANGDEIWDHRNDTVDRDIIKVIRQGHSDSIEEYSRDEAACHRYKAHMVSDAERDIINLDRQPNGMLFSSVSVLEIGHKVPCISTHVNTGKVR